METENYSRIFTRGISWGCCKGVYMWPHVYVDITEDVECFHEEILATVTVVKAKDLNNAIHLANASPYGLSSAIYTNDRLEARFKQIKAGNSINNSTSGAEAFTIWRCQNSGNGTRESGIWVSRLILTGMQLMMN